MLTRIEVQNFRGFEHLAVESFARVNLIAGKNNVGKTALLEASFCTWARKSLLPLRVNSLREVEWLSTQPGEAWGWLFYDRKLTSTIFLRSQDERGQTQNVEIALNWRDQMITAESMLRDPSSGYLTKPGRPSRSAGSAMRLRAGRNTNHEPDHRGRASSASARRRSTPLPLAVYLGATGRSRAIGCRALQRIRAHWARPRSLVAALRILEPRLTRVSCAGDRRQSRCSMANIGLSEWMPLPLHRRGHDSLCVRSCWRSWPPKRAAYC